MILLDLVCPQRLRSCCDSCDSLIEGDSWTSLWGYICCLHFKSLAAFRILRIKILMYHLFFSRISSSSFSRALALYIFCSCRVNRLKLWSSYVESWFGVLISAPQLRGTYWPCELMSLTWCRCGIKQPCLDPSRRSPVCLQETKNRWAVSYYISAKQQHLSSRQVGALRSVCGGLMPLFSINPVVWEVRN